MAISIGAVLFTYLYMKEERQTFPDLLVKRNEWNAREPVSRSALGQPIKRIIVGHTGESSSCHSKDECTRYMRNHQTKSIDTLAYDDVPFNFYIGCDGYMYEGRGMYYIGQHTSHPDASEFNTIGIGIVFIGNYEKVDPAVKQTTALELFLDYFERTGDLYYDYKIFYQPDLMHVTEPPETLLKSLILCPHYYKSE